jgi:hypothetical protein
MPGITDAKGEAGAQARSATGGVPECRRKTKGAIVACRGRAHQIGLRLNGRKKKYFPIETSKGVQTQLLTDGAKCSAVRSRHASSSPETLNSGTAGSAIRPNQLCAEQKLSALPRTRHQPSAAINRAQYPQRISTGNSKLSSREIRPSFAPDHSDVRQADF